MVAKDILFIIKELIPIGKSIYARLKSAKGKSDKNKIKNAIVSDNADYINSIIGD